MRYGLLALLLPKYDGLPDLLTGLQHACRGYCHLLSVGGNHPPVFLSNLIVSPVNRIDRVSVHKFERNGIVDRVS